MSRTNPARTLRLDRLALAHNRVDYILDGVGGQGSARLASLLHWLPPVSGPAAELLRLGLSAWIADRSVERAKTPDRWTRHIEIAFPVEDPETWPAEQAQRLLRFLSNDRWTVIPYEATTPSTLEPLQTPLFPVEADAVDLFSGGLDSYAFAVSNDKEDRLSVAHWDMETLKGLQDRLHANLGRQPDRLRGFHVSAENTVELSSRSRGLLFLTAAIAVASAVGARSVTVPENGFVALNVPLTSARMGALSTRSTHPHTLSLVTDLLDALGVPVGLHNPFLYSTKGDITQPTLSNLPGLAMTVSCSHPVGERWQGDNRYGNCGYCYPCLVRRSGIEAANEGTDPTPYRHDPRTEAALSIRSTDRRADLYAVVARLTTPPHPRDLVRTGPLPRDVDADRIHDMRERSHLELQTMLDNGMTREVRRQLGLA